VILAIVALAAAAAPLHVTGSYETAVLEAGSKTIAKVLCIHTSSADESVMTAGQRQQRTNALQQIDVNWASAGRRERARLALALMYADGAEPSASESLTECRFLLPDQSIVRAGLFYAASTESNAFVLEDLPSGQYLSVLQLGQGSKLPELFRKLYGRGFDAKLDESTKAKLEEQIKEEDARAAAKTCAVAEVNGQRDFLPLGSTEDDVSKSLAAMWDNLDGEPKEHLSRCLSAFALADALLSQGSGKPAAYAGLLVSFGQEARWKHLPLKPLAENARIRRTSDTGHELLLLEPPPDDVLEPFYGERGWTPPDFSLSFEEQVRRLMRGDRD
jgi:hypothetical protein